MKTVILAGGKGTRLSEETHSIPKPMVKIGPYPILWHICSIYNKFDFDDFVIACGYKGDVIKDFFANYYLRSSDWTLDMKTGKTEIIASKTPNWKVTAVDTGLETLTGGRLLRLKDHLPKSTFMLTYGDGVSDVDISKLVDFHRSHGKIATVTGVRPPARFGELCLEESRVMSFSEKSQTSVGWINGGFFVFEPQIFDYLENDQTILERSPLEKLASEGELHSYLHDGFWQPMDTMRDKTFLESIWNSGDAPWSKISH